VRDACPIQRLRPGVRVAILVDDLPEKRCGACVVLPCERRFCEAERQLAQKVALRQKAFDAMMLASAVVDEQDCRRPVRVEALAQTFEFVSTTFSRASASALSKS
jgi:hypothetical protein